MMFVLSRMLGFLLSLVCLFSSFLGCGGDDNSVGNSDSEGIPIVTIKKLRAEKGEAWFRINANSAPKTDLAVWVRSDILKVYHQQSDCYERHNDWIIIPKDQKSSEEFSRVIILGERYNLKIEPLPTISVVGEGLVVDSDELPTKSESLEGHTIPETFEFPLYEVGTPSEIILYGPNKDKEASIVSVNPPSDSVIENITPIIITFDSVPLCLSARETGKNDYFSVSFEDEILSHGIIFEGLDVVELEGEEPIVADYIRTIRENSLWSSRPSLLVSSTYKTVTVFPGMPSRNLWAPPPPAESTFSFRIGWEGKLFPKGRGFTYTQRLTR